MKKTWILTTITITLILSIQMVEVGWSQQAAQAPDFTMSVLGVPSSF